MKKIITIYFSYPEAMGYPFDKEYYFTGYQEITREIERRGVEAYIVRGNSYQGKGAFSGGWRFENNALTPVDHTIVADLVYNKSNFTDIGLFNDCTVINPPEFERLCNDKIKTAAFFPELSPKTAPAENYDALMQTIAGWNLEPTALVVVKKNFLTEGNGVNILPVEDVKETLYNEWSNILVQEFIDSSAGIPGLVAGLHDLRVTMVDDTIVDSFIRTPAPGKLLANLAQGGACTNIALTNIPPEVTTMVNHIQKNLAHFGRTIFCADFMNSPNGFKLVELNSQPGIYPPDWPNEYNPALVKFLVSMVKK